LGLNSVSQYRQLQEEFGFWRLEIEICLMRYSLCVLVLLFSSCGGSLSDEQKKKIREEMELSKIRKVSEADIMEAAFARGRGVMEAIDGFKGDSVRIDSLLKAEQGKIRWIVPGQSSIHETEQQLIDAYISAEAGGQQDNVQKIRNPQGESDSLLYSKPVITQLPDGTDRLDGVWNIWISKKQIILSMDED
jgi:hypothetical protein